MQKEKLLQYLTCPITKLIFCQPVLASDGYFYENMAIKNHLEKSNVSPITGEKMSSDLIAARKIKELVGEFLKENEEYRNDQFLFKKPFFLFKREFLTALRNKEFSDLKEYTNIILNTEVNKNKETLFEVICKMCPDEVIQYIIDRSLDYDTYDGRVLKPLHIACKYASLKVIRHLLAKEVDIHCEDMYGETPLSYLLMYRYTVNELASFKILVREFLELGAKVNKQNKGGLSPAHYVISKGNLDLLMVFHQEYDLKLENISVQLGNMNLVHYAFRESSNYELIKYLIELDEFLDVDVKPDTPSEQLIYQNKNLNKQQKQELVLLYLNKLMSKPLVLDNFMDDVVYVEVDMDKSITQVQEPEVEQVLEKTTVVNDFIN